MICRHPASLPLVLGLALAPIAQATSITFTDESSLSATFPEASRVIEFHNYRPVVSLLPPDRVSLFAGSRTETAKSSRGRVTIYSAATYAAELYFASGSGLTLTVENLGLDYSMKAAGYNGKVGLSSTSTGALDSANAIYFQIDRTSNTFSLIDCREGTPTTLASWEQSKGDKKDIFHNENTINGIFIQALSLTLTHKDWAIDVVFAKKRKPSLTMQFTKSGSFDTEWTEKRWRPQAFLGLESYEIQVTADGDPRWVDLQVGSITFIPNR